MAKVDSQSRQEHDVLVCFCFHKFPKNFHSPVSFVENLINILYALIRPSRLTSF